NRRSVCYNPKHQNCVWRRIRVTAGIKAARIFA
ncbi:MAG: hypothetical protein ACI9MU_001976, partial [Alphaproteobacteria bacterium]